MHWKTHTCSRKHPLHVVKFTDSGYYAFFFSQAVFKIMKVVSLKMVAKTYIAIYVVNVHPNIRKLVYTEMPV